MWEDIVNIGGWLGVNLGGAFKYGFEAYVQTWVWIVDFVLDMLAPVLIPSFAMIANQIIVAVNHLFEKMMPLLHEFIDRVDAGPVKIKTALNGLSSMVTLASAFFPIRESMQAFMAGLGVCASIRLARWLKSIIPTIGD